MKNLLTDLVIFLKVTYDEDGRKKSHNCDISRFNEVGELENDFLDCSVFGTCIRELYLYIIYRR